MLNFGKKGFTLVELIITISILAILGTIAGISYFGYVERARDSNRISELNMHKDSLELFSLRADLPMPENYITIKSGTEIVGYQGDLGTDLLTMIGYFGEGTDPLDNNFYSYERSKNGKYFQILAFLEQPYSINGEIFQFASGEERYPYVVGNGLGILTTNDGFPLHRDENIKAIGEIDLSTTPDGDIIAYVENDLGLITDYSDLLDVVNRGGKGYGIEDHILIDYLAVPTDGVCGTSINSLSLVATEYSQGENTLNVPLGVQADDIILYMSRWLITPPDSPDPTGFTKIFENLSDAGLEGETPDNYFSVYYKFADGSESGNSLPVIGLGTYSNYDNQFVIVLRPDTDTSCTVVNYYSYVNSRSADDPVGVTITASDEASSGKPVFVLGYQRNTTTGQGFDQVESPVFGYEYSLGLYSGGTYAFSIYNSSDTPVNHTIDVSDRATTYNMLVGFYLKFE